MDNEEGKTVLNGVAIGLIGMALGVVLGIAAGAGLVHWCLKGIL